MTIYNEFQYSQCWFEYESLTFCALILVGRKRLTQAVVKVMKKNIVRRGRRRLENLQDHLVTILGKNERGRKEL